MRGDDRLLDARQTAGESSRNISRSAEAHDPRTALKGDAPLVEQVKRLWDKASSEERQAICDRLAREDAS